MNRPKLAAFFVVLASLFRPAFGVFGAGLVIERAYRRQWRDAAQMTAVLAVGTAAVLAWNQWLAHVWLIPSSLGLADPVAYSTVAYNFFFAPLYGVVWFCPWVLAALWALRHDLALAVGLALYVAVVVAFKSADPAASYGPRYWVSVLPLLAVMTAQEGGWKWALVLPSAVISVLALFKYTQVWLAPVTGVFR